MWLVSKRPDCPCLKILIGTLRRVAYHFASPMLATPGEALGERVDLVVMATGKCKQLCDKVVEPLGSPR